ncbi:MAG TPA: methyltransferase domain-containing protein [Actinomycetes bacterium]|nr:methyltransferase domain-containing protein [Actinomycetes bacterium]
MATYTHGHHESVLRSHSWRTAENSAAYLLPHLKPGMHVLDVGCGPGTISRDLATRTGQVGSVLGIDTSADVIARARETVPPAVTNLEFAVDDIFASELPAESFDIAHAHQVLQHLDEPVKALQQMRRLVKPGGIVAARDADYAAMTWYPEQAGLDRWLGLYDKLARGNGGEPNAGRYLLSWAEQAGFSEVTPSASVWCFATPTDREWWGGMQADRTTRSAFAQQAVAASLASVEQLDEMAEAWRSWVTADSSWFVVVHGEVICRV